MSLESLHEAVVGKLIDFDKSLSAETRWAVSRITDRFPILTAATNFLALQPMLLRNKLFDSHYFITQSPTGSFKYGDHIKEGICWLGSIVTALSGTGLDQDPVQVANKVVEITLSNGKEELTIFNQQLPEHMQLSPDEEGFIPGFIEISAEGGLRMRRFHEPEISRTMLFLEALLNKNGVNVKLGYHSFEEITDVSKFMEIVSQYGMRKVGMILFTQIIDENMNRIEGHDVSILGVKNLSRKKKVVMTYDINQRLPQYLDISDLEKLMFTEQGLTYGQHNGKDIFIVANTVIPLRLISAK